MKGQFYVKLTFGKEIEIVEFYYLINNVYYFCLYNDYTLT